MTTALMICPHCGQPVEVDASALMTGLVVDIWQVVRRIYRDGERIDTALVAELAYCSTSTVKRYLHELAGQGVVELRPVRPTAKRPLWHVSSKHAAKLTHQLSPVRSAAA